MSWFSNALSWASAEFHAFFAPNQAAIHSAIATAQEALTAATAVAAVTGHADVAAELGKVQTVVAGAQQFVTAEATATTLTQQAAAVTAAGQTFVDSGVAIKNAVVQAGVDDSLGKVTAVATALQNAAGSAPLAAVVTPAPVAPAA